jgi:hypothetical protein
MKDKEVPQDDEGLLEGKLREVCYAVDESGNYVTVLSTGWSPKNAALKQAWAEVNDKIDATKEMVLAGKLSPLAYFIEKNIMNLKLLAQYSGIPKWKVKRHLKPGNFQKIDKETLEKYARAFDIKTDELINFVKLRNEG